MKLFNAKQTRDEYLSTQIFRSEAKFEYCKVSIKDSLKYCRLLTRDFYTRGQAAFEGPILCLGTRNGREVDLFRSAFFGSRWVSLLLELLEARRQGYEGGGKAAAGNRFQGSKAEKSEVRVGNTQ